MIKQVTLLMICILFTGAISIAGQTATKNSSDATVEALKRATQELLTAVAPGDVAVWQKYLAESCIYTDEEGNVKTKADLLKELRPLPHGYVGTIKMGEPVVFKQENVIVLTHLDREDLDLYGQHLVTRFHSTDTWAKQPDGQWKLVAVQVMAIPNERKPISINPKKLDDYVGQYRLTDNVTYTITREGGQLFGQRTGRAKEELLALYADVLYLKGAWRGEKVFERDANGRVIRLLDRRENNDLVWEKVK
jgi:hypothetical protein